MSGLNYELIYKVRKGRYRTDEKRNLQIQFENKARAEADKLHQAYLDFLTKEIGHNQFEVTNQMCMADGVQGHVYVSSSVSTPKGVGHRKCVFCGCDDGDY